MAQGLPRAHPGIQSPGKKARADLSFAPTLQHMDLAGAQAGQSFSAIHHGYLERS